VDVGAVTCPVLIMMIQTTPDIYAGFLFGVTLLLANVPTLLTVREIKLRHEHNVKYVKRRDGYGFPQNG